MVEVEGIGAGDVYYVDEVRAVEQNEAQLADLQAAIAAAYALHNQAVEGDTPGEYAPGSQAPFLAGIAEAEALSQSASDAVEVYEALSGLIAHQLWFANQQKPSVDRDMLGALIAAVEQRHDETEEGLLLGMVPSGEKAVLLAAVAAAETAYADSGSSQQDVALAYQALDEAVGLFEELRYELGDDYLDMLIDHTGTLLAAAEEGGLPGRYAPGSKAVLETADGAIADELGGARQDISTVMEMLQDSDGWLNGSVNAGADYAEMQGRGIKYTEETWLDETFAFDWTYTYTNAGNDWPGFAIRSQLPNTTIGNGETSYVFLLKRDVWEVQKWVDGVREMLIGGLAGFTPRWGTLANTHIIAVKSIASGSERKMQRPASACGWKSTARPCSMKWMTSIRSGAPGISPFMQQATRSASDTAR
ncbi:hypothetical protein IDH44_15300 [Paenibacillus sp. IB182496]|uniref:Uncharacterized protein n=1 Tax=Paenibacillus sabuli TaxID=2772509 RepID=A0A927BVT2_9BACL|nr:hypothetical protein [Paenibacillus sabuli]MBD2846565.1 hypothetical protein [Paenibacillus sabuli]